MTQSTSRFREPRAPRDQHEPLGARRPSSSRRAQGPCAPRAPQGERSPVPLCPRENSAGRGEGEGGGGFKATGEVGQLCAPRRRGHRALSRSLVPRRLPWKIYGFYFLGRPSLCRAQNAKRRTSKGWEVLSPQRQRGGARHRRLRTQTWGQARGDRHAGTCGGGGRGADRKLRNNQSDAQAPTWPRVTEGGGVRQHAASGGSGGQH